MNPVEFYNLFCSNKVITRFELCNEIDKILSIGSIESIRIFLEETEEERIRDYEWREFDGTLTPSMGYKYWQIIEEYGGDTRPLEPPTREDYKPHHLYDWAIKRLRSKIGDGVQSGYGQPGVLNRYTGLATERAKKYFARAIDAGYMGRTDMGYKWKLPLVRLGYVCGKIYPHPRPITALEKCFGVTKLSASITQALSPAERADVKKWKAEIDTMIFYDEVDESLG